MKKEEKNMSIQLSPSLKVSLSLSLLSTICPLPLFGLSTGGQQPPTTGLGGVVVRSWPPRAGLEWGTTPQHSPFFPPLSHSKKKLKKTMFLPSFSAHEQ